jgi:hypothetical protein
MAALLATLSAGCAKYNWIVDPQAVWAIEDGALRKYRVMKTYENRYGSGFTVHGPVLVEEEPTVDNSAARGMPLWPSDPKLVTDEFIARVRRFEWPWYREPGAIRGAMVASPDRNAWTPTKHVIGLSPFLVASYNPKVAEAGPDLPDSPNALRVDDPQAQLHAYSAARDFASPTLVLGSDAQLMVNVVVMCRDQNPYTKGRVVPVELWILKKTMSLDSLIEALSVGRPAEDVIARRYKL